MSTSIKYSFNFMAGIYVNGMLRFNQYTLNMLMYPTTDNDIDHNVAFDRMNYFINDIVAMSVFVQEDDIGAILKLAQADIPVLTVPAPGPIDQVIQFVLTAKLNAIIEDTFYVAETTIASELGRGVEYVYSYEDDSEDEVSEVSTVISDEIIYWWNDPAPRFVTLVTESEVDEFVPELDWEDMDMGWDGDEDDDGEYEVEGSFGPDTVETDGIKNNIVHFSSKRDKVKDDS